MYCSANALAVKGLFLLLLIRTSTYTFLSKEPLFLDTFCADTFKHQSSCLLDVSLISQILSLCMVQFLTKNCFHAI